MSTVRLIVGFAVVLGLLSSAVCGGQASSPWPQRVLITNDNGIDDLRMVALAQSLAETAEVTVVAAMTDRSGTSNLMSATRSGEFRVERRDLGAGIEAYALDGYPADCVVFALAGPMRDAPPDLVISGINGGHNAGDAWFGSGTIGAARTAAYFGIPAVAVSGLRSGDRAAREAVVAWVTEFVRSRAVRELEGPQYLTVSLPLVPPSEIAGVVVTERARGLLSGRAVFDGDASAREQTWTLQMEPNGTPPRQSDVAAIDDNRIAIVAMRVDESDAGLAAALTERSGMYPEWDASAYVAARASKCRPGLGAMISDAEKPDGFEWGVLINEVLEGGRAAEVGLLANDVIVELNGESLASPPGTPDPVERLQEALADLDCGDLVAFEYMRGTERHRASFEINTPR